MSQGKVYQSLGDLMIREAMQHSKERIAYKKSLLEMNEKELLIEIAATLYDIRQEIRKC